MVVECTTMQQRGIRPARGPKRGLWSHIPTDNPQELWAIGALTPT